MSEIWLHQTPVQLSIQDDKSLFHPGDNRATLPLGRESSFYASLVGGAEHIALVWIASAAGVRVADVEHCVVKRDVAGEVIADGRALQTNASIYIIARLITHNRIPGRPVSARSSEADSIDKVVVADVALHHVGRSNGQPVRQHRCCWRCRRQWSSF